MDEILCHLEEVFAVDGFAEKVHEQYHKDPHIQMLCKESERMSRFIDHLQGLLRKSVAKICKHYPKICDVCVDNRDRTCEKKDLIEEINVHPDGEEERR